VNRLTAGGHHAGTIGHRPGLVPVRLPVGRPGECVWSATGVVNQPADEWESNLLYAQRSLAEYSRWHTGVNDADHGSNK